jgi:uncharacterized protein (UPF0254 family)
MIKIATAECFTHGRIGLEIHSISRGYYMNISHSLNYETSRLSLIAALFIPTLSGVRSILGFEPPEPDDLLDGIKVYTDEKDKIMAIKMAKAVRSITGADIGIGTTAGIGKGAVAVVNGETVLCRSSAVYADLRTSDADTIIKRQESGIEEAFSLLEKMLKDNYS